MRSTSNGEGFTGTKARNPPLQDSRAQSPGNETRGVDDHQATGGRDAPRRIGRLVGRVLNHGDLQPNARSRLASRMIDRWGSASTNVGCRPRKCQCTARQLATVLLPLPPFMVATVMIVLTTFPPPRKVCVAIRANSQRIRFAPNRLSIRRFILGNSNAPLKQSRYRGPHGQRGSALYRHIDAAAAIPYIPRLAPSPIPVQHSAPK